MAESYVLRIKLNIINIYCSFLCKDINNFSFVDELYRMHREEKRMKVITKMDKFFNALCVIILIVLTGLALSQVLFRYVLQISVPWTEELSRLLYGFLIFFGVVLLEAENNQMKTTFLIDAMPRKWQFIIQVIHNTMGIAFLGLMVAGSLRMVRSSWDITLGSLPFISQAVIYIPVIISLPFSAYYMIKQVLFFKEYFPDQESPLSSLTSDSK